jgi:hypothetical protein
MTGSDEAGIAIEKTTRVSIILHGFVTSRYGSCSLLRHDHKEMASQTDGARFMAAALS